MHIHFIQHESFEAPGAILAWAKQKKHTTSFSKVYKNQPLPKSVKPIDCLIIMGGPQTPWTKKLDCPYFDVEAEKKVIHQCIQSQKPVIGFCLGAQLIGEAMGAKAEHSPNKEIGIFPIELTREGLADEKINHFGSSISVGHWHSDMPGLTADSRVLATSEACPRQIIRYSDMVYGFQCHMEFTPEVVELLIKEEENFLLNNTIHKFVQKPDQIRSFKYEEMNKKLFKFLDRLIAKAKP